jgi:hypothetical protein
LSGLIDARKYFILHTPRQTGKTGLLISLMHFINAQGQYRALYVNVEAAQAAPNDAGRRMGAILGSMASAASLYWQDEVLCAWTRARLLIFDCDPAVSWDDKIYREHHTQGNWSIYV